MTPHDWEFNSSSLIFVGQFSNFGKNVFWSSVLMQLDSLSSCLSCSEAVQSLIAVSQLRSLLKVAPQFEM